MDTSKQISAIKSVWITSAPAPKTEKLRADRKFLGRIPFQDSRCDLIALLKQQPNIKPKAVCRELGWTPQKLAGVMKASKGEFVYGIVVVNLLKN